MKLSNLAKYALTITTGAAVLAACSNNGGSSLTPSGASVGVPGITRIGRGVMVRKGIGPYQYISAGSSILEYDYPKGDAPIGSINSSGGAECTNVLFGSGKKTFWVTSSSSNAGAVYEFKVGGKRPIKTLTTTAGDFLAGCAIDPATGNLVAAMLNNGQVVTWAKASGKGTVSQTPLTEAFFAGFDNKSNLYVDGFNSGGSFGFVELPKGEKTWKTLSTSNSVQFPGGVQFDGKYVTVADQLTDDIFGYTCRGTSCTLKQTVSLTGASDCGATWIAKPIVFCADAGNNDVEVYKYPAGGSAVATLTGAAGSLGVVQVVK
jgi:hypothetical protein